MKWGMSEGKKQGRKEGDKWSEGINFSYLHVGESKGTSWKSLATLDLKGDVGQTAKQKSF